ncbi:MAG: sodium:solute symporter family protein, partial [Candidatus Fimenecus sp.]
KYGAWAGILSGFCIAIVPAGSKILNLCGVEAPTVLKLMAQGPLYACIAMLVSIAMCLAVSALTKKKSEKEVVDFFYNGVVENE